MSLKLLYFNMAILGGLLLFCGLVQFGFGEAVDSVAKDLMVTSLERSIDVASQLVKINTKLTLSNEGQTSLKYFHFAIEDSAYDRLSYIGASVSKQNAQKSISLFDILSFGPFFVPCSRCKLILIIPSD